MPVAEVASNPDFLSPQISLRPDSVHVTWPTRTVAHILVATSQSVMGYWAGQKGVAFWKHACMAGYKFFLL